MSPRVSILLPTYEPDPAHLHAAIESVFAQSIPDWELLIQDDASTADVAGMIHDVHNDERVKFSRSEKRLGIGGNWNACVGRANAEFVQFLFQDDVWDSRYLERALKQMDDARIGLVATHHAYLFDGPIEPDRQTMYQALERIRLGTFHDGWNDGHVFLRNWIEAGLRPNLIGEPSFVLLRRALIEKAGRFREDMPQGLDSEYWLRCVMQHDIAFVSEAGGQFRVHAKGASAQNDAEGNGLYDRLGYFETLLQLLPSGELKRTARRSLSQQFAEMLRKFFARKQEGGSVGGGGASVLVRMALRHPILLARGMLLFLMRK